MKNYFALSAGEAIIRLRTDGKDGLKCREARARFLRCGENKIYAADFKEGTSGVFRFVFDPVSLLFIITTAAAAVFGRLTEAAVMAGAWLVYALAVGLSYMKAVSVQNKLKSSSIPQVKVIREGRVSLTDSRKVVPGDLITLTAGDVVCADMRIIRCDGLTADEEEATGIPGAVKKTEDALPEAISPGEAINMLFAGSVITAGRGRAVVTATGAETLAVSSKGLLALATRSGARVAAKVKKAARLQSLLTVLIIFAAVALILIFSKGRDILPVLTLSSCLIACGMCEAAGLLSEICVSRQLFQLSGNKGISPKRLEKGRGDYAAVKEAESVDALARMNALALTDEILTPDSAAELIRLCGGNGVRIVTASKSSNAGARSHLMQAGVFDVGELPAEGNCVCVCDTAQERSALIKKLKSFGGTVGAVSTRLESAAMLKAADISFTYGNLAIEDDMGQRGEEADAGGARSLVKNADVICSGNPSRCVDACLGARGIYASLTAMTEYLLATELCRVILAFPSFFGLSGFITAPQAAVSGFVFDLIAVFIIFFEGKNIASEKSAFRDFGVKLPQAAARAVLWAIFMFGTGFLAYNRGIGFSPASGMTYAFFSLLSFQLCALFSITGVFRSLLKKRRASYGAHMLYLALTAAFIAGCAMVEPLKTLFSSEGVIYALLAAVPALLSAMVYAIDELILNLRH